MTDWVRLWHDMPTDPKWRTIAKRSGRSVSDVIAVFNFVLVNASTNATERGRTHNLFADDIATALDTDDVGIQAILSSMIGKVLDKDGRLLGWQKRQPKREDSSADRARKWREERKQTQSNASERSETPRVIESEISKSPLSSPQGDDNGVQGTSQRARGTRIPLEFSPDAARLSKAHDLGFQDEEIREIVREFVSYWSDIPGSRGLRVNWQGTFENRLSEIAGRKKTSNGKYNIRDSIDTALQFRRSEEARRSGREGSGQDPALLPGLRKSSA